MKKFYDQKHQNIVYVNEEANSCFWDDHWDHSGFNDLKNDHRDYFLEKMTRKYLDKKSKVLEGGCGTGVKVNSLRLAGYDVTGLDFAHKTIQEIKLIKPELRIIEGDVRKLPFKENSFDGYWSLGVIEHFWEGYDVIIEEMFRVLRSGGYAFVTVPIMSSLRKWNAHKGKYPDLPFNMNGNHFYQFALNADQMVPNFNKYGFDLLEFRRLDGVKGLKDEIRSGSMVHRFLSKIYNNNRISDKVFRRFFNFVLSTWTEHIRLFVFKK